MYWRKGIHLSNVKQEWRDVLNIIQRYVTCESMFSIVSRYHVTFILHVNGKSKLNLPYYLFNILENIATRVKNNTNHTSHSIFHHGIVKLLVLTELGKQNRSWQHFLFWSRFEPKKIEAQNIINIQINNEEVKTYVNQ